MSCRAATICLCATLAATASRADEPWRNSFERQGFRIRSEFAPNERHAPAMDALVAEAESLRADLEATLAIRFERGDASRPIDICVFKSRKAYRRHLAPRAPEGAVRPACFVEDGESLSVFVVGDGELMKNFRHETTHALLHHALPFVPLWLDEGLAVYFESPPEFRADPDHLTRLRWAIRFGWRPKLDELEGRKDLAAMSAGDYRHAWGWVHFLLHESGESHEVLEEYLRRTSAGEPPASPGEWIRKQLPNAERRFVRHLNTWGE